MLYRSYRNSHNEVYKTPKFNPQAYWYVELTGVNDGLLIMSNKNWETENHLRHYQWSPETTYRDLNNSHENKGESWTTGECRLHVWDSKP